MSRWKVTMEATIWTLETDENVQDLLGRITALRPWSWTVETIPPEKPPADWAPPATGGGKRKPVKS